MVGFIGLPPHSMLHDVLFICFGAYPTRSVVNTADVSHFRHLGAYQPLASSDTTCWPVGAWGIPLAMCRSITIRLTREMSAFRLPPVGTGEQCPGVAGHSERVSRR